MRFIRTLPLFIAIITAANVAQAQAPAQPAPLKVGVINSDMFSAETGGITRLINALRTLETEFRPRRDEISTLVARFDDLQKAPPAGTTQPQLAARREQAETLQIEIRRKQEDARAAYTRRLTALTDPIRRSVFTSLEAYAKQRGIDLLIDLAKFPDGVLLLNQAADLTPGFIRDYNSKNP